MSGSLNCCYSDGILYTTRVKFTPKNDNEDAAYILTSCILRYDIDLGVIENLIEFENEYIIKVYIYGRYVYVHLVDSIVQYDYRVVRIDLEEENAVVVYSDYKDAFNKNKLSFDLYFTNGRILSPVGNNIYRCDLDLQRFNVFLEFESGAGVLPNSLCMYKNDIFFLCGSAEQNGNNRTLYKYNSKMDEPELLFAGIYDICINGDFLYYSLCEPYEAYRYNVVEYDENGDEFLTGSIVPETFYNGNEIYRIKLDYDYLSFREKVSVYKSEKGYSLGEWKVQNDYIYMTLYTEGDLEYVICYENLLQIKVNSSFISQLFYKVENRQFLHSMKNIK